MDRFEVMRLFMSVADAGSFSKAKRHRPVDREQADRRAGDEAQRPIAAEDLSGSQPDRGGTAYYEVSAHLLCELETAEARIGHG
jgi:hypothetical protein